MTPSDENELYQMLYTGFQQTGPCAIRYPRGSGPGTPINKMMSAIPIGKAEIKRKGKKIALLAFGSLVATAFTVAEKLDATLVNMRFVKPLDTMLLTELANTHSLLVTLEENVISGGAGSAISELYHQQGLICDILSLGLADKFIEHGDPVELLSQMGLNPTGIIAAIERRLAKLATF
jgi:1-deoxy-D-xylulose-5-phosphate synthase